MKILLVLAAVLATASATGTVHPSLLAKAKVGGVQNAILDLPSVMKEVERASTLQTLKGDTKVAALITMLQGLTGAAQAPYVEQLKQLGVQYQQYYASNIVLLKNVDLATIEKIAAVSADDVVIREQVIVALDTIVVERDTNITQNVQWGVQKIRAPEAWAVSDGSGVVVGIIDTGVHLHHVALEDNYAGAWKDPYYNDTEPSDVIGHGTHTLGIIVGTQNGIGVAPGAKWVACRGFSNEGGALESALIDCAQFMLEADPRPQIVSNSWGGGQGDSYFNDPISAWINAGIVPVFAIGNGGTACRSANSPGDQPGVFTVGATTITDAMADFSSRGPSVLGIRKPQVSAPGENIVSAGIGLDNYGTMSGMAAPHVSGAAALILSANPGASVAEVQALLENSAAQPTLTAADRGCGVEDEADFPNNAFGWGRIDVGKALGV